MKQKINTIRTSPRCRGSGFDIKCLKCGGDAQIVYYEVDIQKPMAVKIQCRKCKNQLIIG